MTEKDEQTLRTAERALDNYLEADIAILKQELLIRNKHPKDFLKKHDEVARRRDG